MTAGSDQRNRHVKDKVKPDRAQIKFLAAHNDEVVTSIQEASYDSQRRLSSIENAQRQSSIEDSQQQSPEIHNRSANKTAVLDEQGQLIHREKNQSV